MAGLRPAVLVLLILLTLAAVPGIPRRGQAAESATYRGNAKSRVYHAWHCRYYNCGNCTVHFSSRHEAEAAGFRTCKICLGG